MDLVRDKEAPIDKPYSFATTFFPAYKPK